MEEFSDYGIWFDEEEMKKELSMDIDIIYKFIKEEIDKGNVKDR